VAEIRPMRQFFCMGSGDGDLERRSPSAEATPFCRSYPLAPRLLDDRTEKVRAHIRGFLLTGGNRLCILRFIENKKIQRY
jgi:hypothetical protein